MDVRAFMEYSNATSALRTRLQTHAQEDAVSLGRQIHLLQRINAAQRETHEGMITMAQI